MARPEPLANEHHIARFCGHQNILRDENLHVQGVSPAAFELRVHLEEQYLSCSWLEHHAGTVDEQVKETAKVLATNPSLRRKMGPDSALLRLNVGEVSDCGAARSKKLRILKERSRWNPAYVAVRGMPLDNSDQELLGLLSKTPSLTIHEIKHLGQLA